MTTIAATTGNRWAVLHYHPTIPDMWTSRLTAFSGRRSIALSSEHACAPVSTTPPSDLVVWLERNLVAAAQANRKVWLMFHIPPGIDGYATAMKGREQFPSGGLVEISGAACDNSIVAMWNPVWMSQFDRLL